LYISHIPPYLCIIRGRVNIRRRYRPNWDGSRFGLHYHWDTVYTTRAPVNLPYRNVKRLIWLFVGRTWYKWLPRLSSSRYFIYPNTAAIGRPWRFAARLLCCTFGFYFTPRAFTVKLTMILCRLYRWYDYIILQCIASKCVRRDRVCRRRWQPLPEIKKINIICIWL